MYEKFYHLEADPFRLSPNTKPIYRHASYIQAKTYMLYALRRGEGIVLVTGRPGTGKTALLRDFTNSVKDEHIVTADLVSTQLQSADLIRMIAFSFGVDSLISDESKIIDELGARLLGMRDAGRRLLLLIDEAQNLENEALRKIERLMELRWQSEPLIQIFLIGREPLRELVLAETLKRLYQQVNAVLCLEPLDERGTGEYIRHRLIQVGWDNDPQLADDIFPVIHTYSHGIPRLINLICSQMLLFGMTEGLHSIGPDEINSVLEQMISDQMLPSPLPHIAV
ncbi:ExeA family protein [Sedimenticola hydrogenitrophicus]|uniref:ExeA family protein n=1 Tax=Sedimenticola hydrogenitrophicus TaxID=2967975 RepID=UPI0021A628E3|nr:AAA family ATPase [Sedimenticola hydrogenitrophicus]